MNFDVDTTIEDSNLEIRQVGTEPLKFMTYLRETDDTSLDQNLKATKSHKTSYELS